MPATLIKKKLQHWCFPVNIAKYAESSDVWMLLDLLLMPSIVIIKCFESGVSREIVAFRLEIHS